VIGIAQKKLGYSFNETDPDKMAQVEQELLALKPNICVMNDDTPHNALISGDAIAGYMYGSQIVAARAVMPQLKVVYPEEGLGFGIDCIVTAKDLPHKDAAYIFINYLLDGEVSAWTSDLIDYGNCNTAAVDYMTEEFLSDDTVNAPEEAIASAEMMRPLDEETTKLYDAVWTAFKQS
jgi:spermidine/putrescine transport system substrate-binding protein